MENNQIIKNLQRMVNQTFVFANQIHQVQAVIIDEANDCCTIKTNMQDFSRKFQNIVDFLKNWQRMDHEGHFDPAFFDWDETFNAGNNSNQVTHYTREQVRIGEFVRNENASINDLAKILMDNITTLKDKKDFIPQAKAIRDQVVTFIALKKVQIGIFNMLRK
jgi:hypothetical protein